MVRTSNLVYIFSKGILLGLPKRLSVQGWNLKNRLGDPKSIAIRSIHAKFHVPTMFVIGCRVGGGGKSGGIIL